MKIEYEESLHFRYGKNARDIPVGTCFMGRIGERTGLFLRIAGSIATVVLLDDPRSVWSSDPRIDNYQSVHAVVVVKGPVLGGK